MNKIIIPISKKIQNLNQSKIEEISSVYGMEIPSHIHLFLSAEFVKKMNKIKDFFEENNLSEVSFLNSTRNSPDNSYIELFKDDKKLNISQYEDFDKLWNTVDTGCFRIDYSFQTNCQFQITIIYACPYSEFIIKTAFFDLPSK